MFALIVAASIFAQQDSGAFVVRLGNDTLSLEQYKRTATQLRGEFVIRSPRTVHRIYTADLNADGSIRRIEVITHNIGGGPGPAETKGTFEFVGDSAIIDPLGRTLVEASLGEAVLLADVSAQQVTEVRRTLAFLRDRRT